VSGKMTGCPGLLLYGPSGTGKTLIARALSRLGGLELISVKVTDLKGDVWIGSASRNVRELWTRARAAQGKVLMFIDELDAIDGAILSRFVEQIEIPLPDQFQRKQLLEVFLRGVSADNISEIAEQLALVTADYSGRDLQQLVSRAILKAVKRSGNANTLKLKRSDFCPVGAEDKDMGCSAQRESRWPGT
jgi:SpoVK/Ycf46/Vps4 family AAA+-type ATPase